MSITITDPELLAQLRRVGEVVELKDPEGNVLGTFAVEGLGKLPPGVVCPISDEELERRRRENRIGRPLADILKDLEARG